MTQPEVRPGETALVIVAELPGALEALRRRGIPNAADGVPAHITLLYPFADPDRVFDVLPSVATIVARHPAAILRLVEGRRWPGVLYASVEPAAPLRALQEELAHAFPSLPLYGGAFDFEPHLTIVEGDAADAPDALADPAWSGLPVTFTAQWVDLIGRRGDRWSSWHRFPLEA